MKTSCFFALFLLVLLSGCAKEAQQPATDCFEGTIVEGGFYRRYTQGCFDKSFWLSVDPKYTIGRDVFMPTPAPGPPPPKPGDNTYKNIVEVAVLSPLGSSVPIDSLGGEKIHFRYRLATPQEIEQISPKDELCASVRSFHNIPVVVLTSFSLEQCPANGK